MAYQSTGQPTVRETHKTIRFYCSKSLYQQFKDALNPGESMTTVLLSLVHQFILDRTGKPPID